MKPITETQKATTREITEGLRPITEGIENLPQAITFPAYPSIQAEADTTYGLYDKDGKFYISNKPAIILGNDIVVGKDEYDNTPGLWELIVSKEPKEYTFDDYKN